MNSVTFRCRRGLMRLAGIPLTSALAVLVFAGPAAADVPVPLNDAHKNTTAAAFPEQTCDDQLPQVPGQDGWHFVLPAQGNPDAVFTSVTLTFEDLGGNQTQLDAVVGNPTDRHATIYTPAGWTLVDGTAQVSPDADPPDFFNLSHTCPATSSPSPSVSPSESPSGSPSESPSESPTASPSETPTAPTTAPTDVPTKPGNGELPVTGMAVTSLLLAGLGMLGSGLLMRAVRRRARNGEPTGQ